MTTQAEILTPIVLSWHGEFRLFDRNGRDISPSGKKARALLAYLAAKPDVSITREHLAELLWSGNDALHSRNSLRKCLQRLRPFTVGDQPVVEVSNLHLKLRGTALTVPSLLNGSADNTADLGEIRNLLRVSDGTFLENLDCGSEGFDDWLWAERSRLRGNLMQMALESAEAALESGKPEELKTVREIVDRLEVIDDLNERVVRLGLRVDGTSGDNAALIRRFNRLEERLWRELRVDPAVETKVLLNDLLERVSSNTKAQGDGLGKSAEGEAFEKPGQSGYARKAREPEKASKLGDGLKAPVPTARRRWAAWAFTFLAFALVIALLIDWRMSEGVASERITVGPIETEQGDAVSAAFARDLQGALIQQLSLGGLEPVSDEAEDSAAWRITARLSKAGQERALTLQVRSNANNQVLWTYQTELGDDAHGRVRHYIPWVVGNAVVCGVKSNEIGGEFVDPLLVGYFIRGCNDFRETGSFEQMLVNMHNASIRFPKSDLAKVRYAIAAAWTGAGAASAREAEQLNSEARDISSRMVREYPQSAIAHYALGLSLVNERDYNGARTRFEEALRLQPSYPYTSNVIANVLGDLGYVDEALDVRKRAVVADHFSIIQPKVLALALADKGNFIEAHKVVDKIEPIDPLGACEAHFLIEYWSGDPAKAGAILAQPCLSAALDPITKKCARAFIEFRKGGSQAEDVETACRTRPVSERFRYAVSTGRIEEAIAMAMNVAPREFPPDLLFREELAQLRRHPRFMELAAHFGLVSMWQKSEHWPDFCTDGSVAFDCKIEAERVARELHARAGKLAHPNFSHRH